MTTVSKELDKRLTERQARENAICPVREELFSQAFDEIIRQVTINCPERGLLLHRVRDELKMTIAAYQTLYKRYVFHNKNSAVVFGMRKHIQSREGMAERQRKIEELTQKKENLKTKEIELRCKIDAIDKKNKNKAEIVEKIRAAELESLRHQGKEVQDFTTSNQEATSPKSPTK